MTREEAFAKITGMDVTISMQMAQELLVIVDERIREHLIVHPDPTCNAHVATLATKANFIAVVQGQAELALMGEEIDGVTFGADSFGTPES